ncbi:hypothetical protein BGZ75_009359 [Mortierella antarctica]|nr:hypothetical protein BGZ67_008780 [Mortierella alpina]KAF9979665.1 hypothetical protein BGZ75_009359 [Mortierella antarctica]
MNSRSFDGDQAPSRARGYQYDPADSGKWTNVDVTDKYKWSILTGSTMFYATVNGGDPVLMHVYGTSHVVDTITVSIFNKATNTFMEQNTTWALVKSRANDIPHLAA